MSSSALLVLIALVASLDGDRATVEGQLLDHLLPGDVGHIRYELKVADEVRTIDVGTAEVLSVGTDQAEVRLTSDREVRPGFAVRFEVPLERLRAEEQADAELRQAYLTAQADLATAVVDNEALLARVAELEQDLERRRGRTAGARAPGKGRQAELEALQAKLAEEREAREAAQAELAALEVKLEAAESGRAELEKSLDETRAELAAERELRAAAAPPPPEASTAEAAPPPAEAPTAAEAAPPPPEAPTAAEAPPAPTVGQLEARVRAWAEAWSKQDVGSYLSFYAAAYEPPGMSRGQWVTQRTARLEAPEFIEIGIEAFELRSATPERAEVRFEQTYRSDTFQDRVTKTLELVLDDGEWRIAREQAQ